MTVAFDNLTLSQRVYEHLREEILADHLLPGTELSEVALSKELAISRGPIREAMGRLSAEGLITMRPRRRAEVRSLTPQELIDAYQVREALEVMAVRLAIPRLTEADLARLDQLMERMAGHIAEGAVREFFAANVSFHETAVRAERQPETAGGAPPARRRDRPVPVPHAGPARQHGRLADRAPRDPGGYQAPGRGPGGRAHRGPHQGARGAAPGGAAGRCPGAGRAAGASLGEGSPAAVSRAESSGAGASRAPGPRGPGPRLRGCGAEACPSSRSRGPAPSWPFPTSPPRSASTGTSSGSWRWRCMTTRPTPR